MRVKIYSGEFCSFTAFYRHCYQVRDSGIFHPKIYLFGTPIILRNCRTGALKTEQMSSFCKENIHLSRKLTLAKGPHQEEPYFQEVTFSADRCICVTGLPLCNKYFLSPFLNYLLPVLTPSLSKALEPYHFPQLRMVQNPHLLTVF